MSYPPLLSEDLQPRLGQIFEEELKHHAWSAVLEPFYPRLQATGALIYEKLDGEQCFSNALWDLCFPRMNGGEFWHHTDLENLDSIVQSGEVWLHPIKKRMSEGELVEFASSFDYRGFFSTAESGNRIVDEYSEDLFYLSLTSEEGPSEHSNYGEVRLRFRVTPVLARAELRRMQYEIDSNHPLRVLRKLAKQRFNRDFLPWGVSRMASFQLDPFFSWEQEVRLLIKRFEQTTDLRMRRSGSYDAVGIPIGLSNSRALIELTRIEADGIQSMEKVKALLAASSFNSVPIGLQP